MQAIQSKLKTIGDLIRSKMTHKPEINNLIRFVENDDIEN